MKLCDKYSSAIEYRNEKVHFPYNKQSSRDKL